jgi:hypothetical protein
MFGHRIAAQGWCTAWLVACSTTALAATSMLDWAKIANWPNLIDGMWAVAERPPANVGAAADAVDPLAAQGFRACEPFSPLMIAGAAHPLKFFYTRGEIIIMTDGDTLSVRRIFMDGRSADDYDPSFAGISFGKWEARTLVVETYGLDQTVKLRGGLSANEATRLHERFEFSPPDRLSYHLRVADPRLTTPWEQQLVYTRRKGWDLQLTWCSANREEPARDGGPSRLNLTPPTE